MEYLSIFYRIINEDFSPLSNNLTKENYVNFLKQRFPDYIKQYAIRLKGHKDTYEIDKYAQTSFNGLIGFRQNKIAQVNGKTKVLEFAIEQLKIENANVVYHSISQDDDQWHLEVHVKDDYQALSIQEAKFHFYKVTLNEAVCDLKKKVQTKVFKLKSEKAIKRYIRNYQTLTTSYMQTILRDFIPSNELTKLFQLSDDHTATDIFKMVYQSLEEVLVYLEKSFDRYLDTSLFISHQSRLWFAINYAEKLSCVLDRLELARLDDKLYPLVMMPFDRLGTQDPLSFSYESHSYHKAYLEAFYQAIQEGKILDRQETLLILWRMNFNTLRFFNYLTNEVKRGLSKKDRTVEKLELLYYYQKLSNQLPVKTQRKYNPKLLPLKEQMAVWLQEEIGFQRIKLKHQDEALPTVRNKGEKLQLNMSVAQLSQFLRALFETGLVAGTRQELLRFISTHYRTDQQGNISVESLKGKYYKVDTGTKRTVSRMMKKMLAHIESVGKNY